MKLFSPPLFILLLLVLFSCKKDTVTPPVDTITVTQGNRILGMDVKEVPSVSYDEAYTQAAAIGVREVSLSLDWGLLETSTGIYDNSIPDIINLYYPNVEGDLTLVLRPLDTPGPSLPSDLEGMDFDNLAVISAFENLLTNLHNRLPNLNATGKLKWIHVGNEIDSYLGNDAVKWSQWQTFFNAAKTKIESLWGTDIHVSSIIQFHTLQSSSKLDLYNELLPSLDKAVLTYYPLSHDITMNPPSVVSSDFELMASTILDKSIIIQECGYSSSSVSNSSEALQADFISAVFDAWDIHKDKISLIDFTWQYDASESEVNQWIIDYGMSGNIYENQFKHYLWSLGLNNHDGTEKLAMQRLRNELLARDWEQ